MINSEPLFRFGFSPEISTNLSSRQVPICKSDIYLYIFDIPNFLACKTSAFVLLLAQFQFGKIRAYD